MLKDNYALIGVGFLIAMIVFVLMRQQAKEVEGFYPGLRDYGAGVDMSSPESYNLRFSNNNNGFTSAATPAPTQPPTQPPPWYCNHTAHREHMCKNNVDSCGNDVSGVQFKSDTCDPHVAYDNCGDEWRTGYIDKCVPKTQDELIDWAVRNGTKLNNWCFSEYIKTIQNIKR